MQLLPRGRVPVLGAHARSASRTESREVTDVEMADLEQRLRELDVRSIYRVEQDNTWEVTTFERAPHQHWHGVGSTLEEALDDLARWILSAPRR